MDPLDLSFLGWGSAAQLKKKKSCGCIWFPLSCLDWPGNREVSLRRAAVGSFPLETRTQRTARDRQQLFRWLTGCPGSFSFFRFIYPSISQHRPPLLPLPINPQGKWSIITLDTVLPSPFSSPLYPRHTFHLALCVCVLGLPEHSKTEAIASCLAHVVKQDM